MPVLHSPPAMNIRSQRHQAVLTPTVMAPLKQTPSVNQLSENLNRGPSMEGSETPRRGGPRRRLGEDKDEQGESEETKVAAALAGSPKAFEAPNLAPSHQPLVSEAEPNFLKMMEQMTHFMGQLTEELSPRDTSRAPQFKTPLMKAPYSFDCTKAYKLRGFI
ncbi:hypothetical protein O181_021837 [Austropuccinia psidii MF-1]|uniref:Uncharacterized protein n=1 Tax=Austropuccinia psidii MF-1 TaxID=1389203 RepID=A0A9Q3CED3_9BASI|nr:hypothetical protein [Austropuccinia psidii MF-1]